MYKEIKIVNGICRGVNGVWPDDPEVQAAVDKLRDHISDFLLRLYAIWERSRAFLRGA